MLDSNNTIYTDSAPSPLGRYSQAIRVGNTVYISGQLPIDPSTGLLIDGTAKRRIHQVFKNLHEICLACNASLAEVVKLSIYLTDLQYTSLVNDIMDFYFQAPYPARSVVGVNALPSDSFIEVDAVMVCDSSLR